jgi:hypothetical protein
MASATDGIASIAGLRRETLRIDDRRVVMRAGRIPHGMRPGHALLPSCVMDSQLLLVVF